MKKKRIIIIICAAVVLVSLIVPLSVAFSNKSMEKKLYNSYYTLPEDFIIEAKNGCLGQKENSLEFIKTAYQSGANCVELDLTFDPNGVPYIQRSQYKINEEALSLEEVLNLISGGNASYKNCFIDLNINSTDNLPILEELCKKYAVEDRVFLSGVNLNQAQYVKSMTNLPYYLTIELKNSENNDYLSKVFNDVSNSGALGIICDYKNLSQQLHDILFENWLKISFDNINTKKQCVNALKASPNIIKTDKPYLVHEIAQKWQAQAPPELYGMVDTTEK